MEDVMTPIRKRFRMIRIYVKLLMSGGRNHQTNKAKRLPHVPGAKGRYPTLKTEEIQSDR